MQADKAFDQTNIVSMVKQFNLLVEKAGLPALQSGFIPGFLYRIDVPESADASFSPVCNKHSN